ncbi:MAG TPA: Rne/Rng family ribonuclease [Pyrinomonadaceae bacterium]|nr:Rne/Rng family ribonuclease [Pyrinomonadaceae bacterium]
MSKELIVSLNGREKKIAIIENGRTTEFYIERGENSQGIVGNIYKGRVMRVLPGMQSAFVDIGLERDAFLYVSDFFDEEEEFERIVVDKTKGEGADPETATRAAAERIERARIERERQMETAQERAEPAFEEDAPAVEILDSPIGAMPAQRAEIADSVSGEEMEARASGRRGGRNRQRGRGEGERIPASQPRASSAGEPATTPPRESRRAERMLPGEDINTPFVSGADSFQRVVDEDEAAVEEGSMFKDARLQERLLDQIHAIEFDIEDVATAEVGSLLSASPGATSIFQRIDDGEAEADDAQSHRQKARRQTATSVTRLADELSDDSPSPASFGGSFERVSDDEVAVEAVVASPDTTVADLSAPEKGGRTRRGTRAKEAASTINETAPDAAEVPAPKKRSGAARGAATGAAAKKKSADESNKPDATRNRSRRAKTPASDDAANSVAIENEASQEAGRNADVATLADADASISSSRSRGEFARRGGRRRRRPAGSKPATEGGGEEAPTNGDGEDAELMPEPEEVVVAAIPETAQPAPEKPAPRGGRTRGEEDGRPPRADSNRASRGDGGRGDNARGGPRAADDARSSGGGRDRRDRQQPTITDLLREGQEIIVQIAKEPIAAKGARITSHIALPGRFLVYMPTIEHVGVSRKIESDAERVRLRKLIQTITKEEDVPSGGFIVRTAGVGITESDLRDDARYLVRTWRDIRRSAEKAKAPALAHRDLDLVQRILRDQLSDEFTAIRVDSEEEYQEVVEFVNRIQPRLVNRVKLYTREEPILEAYGVQAEIDKAIKPRVWLRSGGYLVINQTEALVAIDVNTGKFVGRGGSRLEDTITRTNLEAVDEIARQIRLRDLGGIIVLDLIDMEERRNRQRVMTALQDALRDDKSPTKVLSFNDFGLVIMTRKRVKQSLERTLCSPCPYCQGSSLVKSPQTVCYEVLEEARRLARGQNGERFKQTTLRLNPEVARALRSTERDVLTEIEEHLGAVDISSDEHVHQEQFDFAVV